MLLGCESAISLTLDTIDVIISTANAFTYKGSTVKSVRSTGIYTYGTPLELQLRT